MKKLISLCLLLFTGFLVNAQQNFLPPIGNVGVNTLRPMYPLDVKGEAYFVGPVTIDSLTNLNGLVNTGVTVLEGLTLADSSETPDFILGTVNGLVQGIPLPGLNNYLTGLGAANDGCFEMKLDANGIPIYVGERIPPMWDADAVGMEGWLYTGLNCITKVGIGLDRPERFLDVRGDAYFENAILVGDGTVNQSVNGQTANIEIGMNNDKGLQIVGGTTASNRKFVELVGTGIQDAILLSGLEKAAAGGEGRQVVRINGSGELAINRWQTLGPVFSGAYRDHLGVEMFGNGSMALNFKELDSNNPDETILDISNGDTPILRLKENGKLYSNEIVITLPPNFPDYVFEKDYSRLSFSDLKSFLTNEKHLPGMPKAAEVAKEGQNVGEIQVKTVEKLEELYLYVLELEKRLSEMEKENKALKSK